MAGTFAWPGTLTGAQRRGAIDLERMDERPDEGKAGSIAGSLAAATNEQTKSARRGRLKPVFTASGYMQLFAHEA
jgi:hypothetical protein